jgi:hypothetical protein
VHSQLEMLEPVAVVVPEIALEARVEILIVVFVTKLQLRPKLDASAGSIVICVRSEVTFLNVLLPLKRVTMFRCVDRNRCAV